MNPPEANVQIAPMLKRVPLFSHLPDDQIAAFSRLMVPTKAKNGQVILMQGEPVESFIVVCSGELAMLRRSRDGRERIVAMLRPGMHFGLAEMITSAGSAATLRAEQNSTLAVLNNSSFRREVLANPALSYALMQTMARSIFRLVRELEYATFESVPQRLARALLALADSHGLTTSEGIQILDSPTHQDLANLVGSSRETVTRALAKMQDDGLVKVGYRRLTILNAKGLAAVTEGE